MNIVIIGAGPAGEAAAKSIRVRNKDATITLIEKSEAGGLCLNKGCIPSKTLLEQVHQNLDQTQDLRWSQLQEFKSKVVVGIRQQLEMSLKRLKVDLKKGSAQFSGPNAIEVSTLRGTETIPFDKAILTAGTENVVPPPFDAVKDQLLDSDRILELDRTLQSITIVGGGAVGLEFACLMNAMGTQVHIVELQEGILPGEDGIIVSALTRIYEARGIKVLTGTKVTDIKQNPTDWVLTLSNGQEIVSEQVLVCVGRAPKLDGFGLDKAGVEIADRKIKLNDKLQTTNPNIYAAGDVTGLTRLAHAAASMGEVAGANCVGAHEKYDGTLVPRALYSWPEVASVGKWKYECEKEGIPVKSSRAFFKGSSKALAAGQTDGIVQIVFHEKSEQLLGAQILGAHATELIHVFCVALSQKMTKKQLGKVMFAHPTLSELIKDACLK